MGAFHPEKASIANKNLAVEVSVAHIRTQNRAFCQVSTTLYFSWMFKEYGKPQPV